MDKTIIGQRFSRLVILEYLPGRKNPQISARCFCICDCGNTKWVRYAHLRSGVISSCRCFSKEQTAIRSTKHGHNTYKNGPSPTYNTWVSMVSRCSDKNSKDYKRYGGRGIRVCKRWLKFENFLTDMKVRPKGTTLDRINNNKGYNKANCKWSTPKQQARNRRTNTLILFRGQQHSIAYVAEKLDIKYNTLLNRINKGKMSLDEALSKPVRHSLAKL